MKIMAPLSGLRHRRHLSMHTYVCTCAVAAVIMATACAGGNLNNNENAKHGVAPEALKDGKTTYIVHVAAGDMPTTFNTVESWYDSMEPNMDVLYRYENALQGFAARMTPAQAEQLRRRQGVLSVQAQNVYHLHTTRTPAYLGLRPHRGLWPDSSFGRDVVIGLVDTGVWPEHPSFSDAALGSSPPPKHWRGDCQGNGNFTCNNKIIGARFFHKGFGPIDPGLGEVESPRDMHGHGTHTASTAAGAAVPNASFHGYAAGTASGMAPQARIATYKVCWTLMAYCADADILAAIDAAVADGVDVLSISLGGDIVTVYNDSIAIGVFGAVSRGIFVSCSSGNNGPYPQSLVNGAPWITTVAASTLDREFPTFLRLGSSSTGKFYEWAGIFTGHAPQPRGLRPLLYAGNATFKPGSDTGCAPSTLDPKRTAGKIVLCDSGGEATYSDQINAVSAAGGAGVVFSSQDLSEEEVTGFPFPAINLNPSDLAVVREYALRDPRPRAEIHFDGTVVDADAPAVANFSSRGPNPVFPSVPKPDITAPGVNILAAWSGDRTVANVDGEAFHIISGTSMACPHVSGIAALVRAEHPDWSPAAVRSALMTTATPLSRRGRPLGDRATGGATAASATAMGSGTVKPQRAARPGLVYNITAEEYLRFLCSAGYTQQQIDLVSRAAGRYSCSSRSNSSSGSDLNYPSFAVLSAQSVHRRTVTNVGKSVSTYRVSVRVPHGVTATVIPDTLAFTERNQQLSYSVSFKVVAPENPAKAALPDGELVWSNGKASVRSPISFLLGTASTI